jgi:hypothetical protein
MKMPKLPQKARPDMVVGVAWYREADWPRVKQLFPDATSCTIVTPNG